MSLMDTLDGVLMSRAYDWAFSAPIRRVFYNLVITGLSITVAVLIGTIELGGLLAAKLNLTGPFWSRLEAVNINTLGYAVLGTFLLTWVLAVSVWRFGHIEQRWARLLVDHDGAASRGNGS
jgi:high-affinity nickel-transport protein